MNASPEKEWRNPWEQRAEFAKVAPRNLAFSLVIVFLCALAIPLAAFDETVTLLVLAALFIYVVGTVRAPFAVTMLLGTAFLTYSLTNTLVAATVVLAFVVGIGAMTFLLTAMPSPVVPLFFPVAATCAAYAVLGDWRLSLLSLGFVPAAVLLAVATRVGKGRTTAICFGQVGLLLAIAAGVGYVLYTGSVAREITVSEYVELLKEDFLGLVLRMQEQRAAVSQEVFGADAKQELLSPEVVPLLVDYSAKLFPAICCVICGVVVFEAQILLNGLYRNAEWKQVLTPHSMVFTMSLLGAILYFATFLLALIPWENPLVSLTVLNLNVMLLPGFCVIGFTMLMLNFARSKGGARMIWILLLGGVFCFAGALALPLLAMFGSNSVVMSAMYRRLSDKSEHGADDDRE